MLRAEELRVDFRTGGRPVAAVNGVDLEINRGEILGLVGETGSGKTVTSLALMGLVRPPGAITGGRVLLDDVDVLSLGRRELRAWRGRRIGYVPQNPRTALNPLLRVERQMANVASSHGLADRVGERCLGAIESVGIADPERVLRAYPHELSGGMAQRVVIATALLLEPDLVVADEPTTGLDVTIQAQILDLFADAVLRRRAGALLVTHDLGVVAAHCARVAVMYAGRIVETGPTRDVLARPRHPYTVGLLRSVPVLGEPLYSMPGQAPDLRALPAGCAFAERCPHAEPHFRAEPPPLRSASPTHRYRCHLPEGAPFA